MSQQPCLNQSVNNLKDPVSAEDFADHVWPDESFVHVETSPATGKSVVVRAIEDFNEGVAEEIRGDLERVDKMDEALAQIKFIGEDQVEKKFDKGLEEIANDLTKLKEPRKVFVAILAKDKEMFLPLFLKCLLQQTVDKKRIILYIRSNNNTDKTIEILKKWVAEHGAKYAQVIEEYEDVPQKVERFKPHDWNAERFSVLAKIRQRSLQLAHEAGADYYVIDCDNFTLPRTLEYLLEASAVRPDAVIAPLLHRDPGHAKQPLYSNMHAKCDSNGYWMGSWEEYAILLRQEPGLHACDVVHCTYFIPHDLLPKMSYSDGTDAYEYVIFSRTCRKKGIPQLMDNRIVYGWLTLAESLAEFNNEKWFGMFGRQRTLQLAAK